MTTFLSRLVALPRRIVWGIATRIGARFAGPNGSYVSRLTVFGLVFLGTLGGLGLYFALTTSASTSASSAPFLTTILDWSTNGWGYVLLALFFGRSSLWGFRKSLVRKAALKSGYSMRTIERVASEARTTDGCNRIPAFADDSVAGLAQNLRWGFEGKHERIKAELKETEYADVESWWSGELASDWETGDDERDLLTVERWRLFRMDLATSLDADTLLWRFAVPACVVFVIELLVVRVWVSWWLYPVFVVIALFVAGLFYAIGTYRRHRKLNILRRDRGEDEMDSVSVLVKKAEAEDATMYYGFLAGRSYASDDPEKLSRVLAERALQRANGKQPAPAIEERFAWCLKRYVVSLDSYVKNREKRAIMDALSDAVNRAPDGFIAKDHLADEVVEHDRRTVWQGLRHVGFGYDRDLVAECYADIVPNTLVEKEITVDGANDETRDVTVVRKITEPLPPGSENLRAQFSDRFRARDYETRYSLPDVDSGDTADPFVRPASETPASAD